jgi:hypothetical protein
VIKPAYSVSFLLSINIFVWQNVLYFPNDLLCIISVVIERTALKICGFADRTFGQSPTASFNSFFYLSLVTSNRNFVVNYRQGENRAKRD